MFPIEHLTGLTHLSMNNICNDPSNFYLYLPMLDFVELELANVNIGMIDELAHYPNLEVLNLGDNQIVDVSVLQNLHKLKELNLKGNRIQSFDPLSNLTELKRLDLSYNSVEFQALMPILQPLMSLSHLSLNGISGVTDTLAALPLHDFVHLELADNIISDIAHLSNYPNLEVLNLEDNRITDISVIQGLQQLMDLNLKENRIDQPPSLANLTGLWKLDLSNNPIELSALVPVLEQLTGLTHLALNNIHTNQDILAAIPQHDYTGLELANTDLSDINQLSNFPNLKILNLADNQITDASTISNLHQLIELNLNSNQINSLPSLPDLFQLKKLDLSDNPMNFPYLVPLLEQLPGLSHLALNNIRFNPDSLPLLPLHGYIELELANTQISDISHLENYHKLKSLNLAGNQITDFLPISELRQMERLDISGNPTTLQNIYILYHLPMLSHLALNNIDLAGIHLPMADLEELELANTNINDIFEMGFYPKLRSLKLEGNLISDLDPFRRIEFDMLRQLNLKGNLIESIEPVQHLLRLERLNISDNPGITGYHVPGILAPLRKMTHLAMNNITYPLGIIDNLPSHDFLELELAHTQVVYTSGLERFPNLRALNLEGNQIEQLIGFENLHQLKLLNLKSNRIQGITPIQNLVNLKRLDLSDNPIEGYYHIYPVIDQLTALTHLGLNNIQFDYGAFDLLPPRDFIELSLAHTQINNIRHLVNYPNLISLNLEGNKISDLTPLYDLKQLRKLNLKENLIEDATPIQDLKQLKQLDLSYNLLWDYYSIAPVLNQLTGLTHLGLSGVNFFNGYLGDLPSHDLVHLELENNLLTDISALSNYPNLHTLNLEGNRIADLTPIQSLNRLKILNLKNNQITDLSPINMNAMEQLDLSHNPGIGFPDLEYLVQKSPHALTHLALNGIHLPNLNFLQPAHPGQGRLTSLELADTGTNDISILADFKKLRSLDLASNNVTDLEPLRYLDQLRELNLMRTQIRNMDGIHQYDFTRLNLSYNPDIDIAEIADLVRSSFVLTHLDISGIPIHDLSVLGLSDTHVVPGLVEMKLAHTGISDISDLVYLPILKSLDLEGNQIRDLRPLRVMRYLEQLNLKNNLIVDVNPIPMLYMERLNISDNPGIDVTGVRNILHYPFSLTHLALNGISINNLDILDLQPHYGIKFIEIEMADTGISDFSQLTTSSFHSLKKLNLAGNKITDVSLLPAIPYLRQLNLKDNQISDVASLHYLYTLRELDLSGNANIDINQIKGMIPYNLYYLTQLGLSGIQLDSLDFLPELPYYISLGLADTGISDISRLGYYENLKHLDLSGNRITNINALFNMNRRISLDLSNNPLEDLDQVQDLILLNKDLTHLGLNGLPLEDLTILNPDNLPEPPHQFIELKLANTRLVDINPLAEHPGLRVLDLSENAIVDLTSLGTLTNLESLNLTANHITDVTALQDLTGLNQLILSNNPGIDIESIKPVVAGNTGLMYLGLNHIPLQDLSVLNPQQLPEPPYQFLGLELAHTRLTDISQLSAFPYLRLLDLKGNQVQDVSPLWGMNQLDRLNLSDNNITDFQQVDIILHHHDGFTHLGLSGITLPDGNLASLKLNPGYEELELARTGVSDISLLAQAPNLRTLDLKGNQVHDVSPLWGMYHLERLNVSDNNAIDFNQLHTVIHQNQTRLTHLGISGIALPNGDLRPIDPYPGYVELELARTQLQDISHINLAANLQKLDLGTNRINDLSPLVYLHHVLDRVDLSHNPLISDLKPLYNVTDFVLTHLDLTGNDQLLCEELDQLEAALQPEALIRPANCDTNTPPQLTVVSPENETVIQEGGTLALQATSSDADEGDLTSKIEWSSSIDGPLGQGGSLDVMLTAGVHTITARVIDRTGNQVAESRTVIVHAPLTYCDSRGRITKYEWIESMTLGDFSNVSGNNGGYGDFTAGFIKVNKGDLNMTLAPGHRFWPMSVKWKAWIDFNQDGIFDQTEQVYSGRSRKTIETSITIPETAKPGGTRMRVSMKWGILKLEPCSDIIWGEVEDYMVVILN